jgi:glycosyltransferase involved in cell wall biosynthesis
MSTPKVSIVTPSLNQAQFLPLTLQSVRAQTYPNIEHIVVDGGSTDGTVEILRSAPAIRWLSEPDRGQVHAINKGFAMATGEILAWLNSDDTLYPDAVGIAVEALERTGADLVYGDVEIVEETGRLRKLSRGIPFDLPVLLYGINYIGQQTVFFRRRLLQRAGPLREQFDNAFDYELWLRMARHGRFAYVPALRGQIRVHPRAKSIARARVTRQDIARIRAEYWADGGLPAVFRAAPLFAIVNALYRLKRQWRARTPPGPSFRLRRHAA